MRLIRDPLLVRFFSGLTFAAAFIWVAIEFFGADKEAVKNFAISSALLILGLIVLGFIFSFVLRILRRGSTGMLDHIEEIEKDQLRDNEKRDDSVEGP